jgi:hypothetical protein
MIKLIGYTYLSTKDSRKMIPVYLFELQAFND